MTDRLDEIKARLGDATPGPWSWLWCHAHGFVAQCDLPPHDITSQDLWSGKDTYMVAEGVSDGDGEFIAHAPEDIKWLIAFAEKQTAEIERLRAEMERWQSVLAGKHPPKPLDSK